MSEMVVVKAGKFQMCLISWVIATNTDETMGKGLDPIEARRKIFEGITGVEGTREEFERINEMLDRYPIFKKFDLGEEHV